MTLKSAAPQEGAHRSTRWSANGGTLPRGPWPPSDVPLVPQNDGGQGGRGRAQSEAWQRPMSVQPTPIARGRSGRAWIGIGRSIAPLHDPGAGANLDARPQGIDTAQGNLRNTRRNTGPQNQPKRPPSQPAVSGGGRSATHARIIRILPTSARAGTVSATARRDSRDRRCTAHRTSRGQGCPPPS